MTQKGNDFGRNPGGSAAGGPKPRDLTQGQAPAQRRGGDGTLNPASVPEGGTLPPNMDPKGEDKGNPIGAGTPGRRPPFRLNG